MTMTTKELLALVGKAIQLSVEARYGTGYTHSELARVAMDAKDARQAAEDAATALCAEVEALTVAAKSARRALARAAQMDPAFNGAYQEIDAAIDAAKEPK